MNSINEVILRSLFMPLFWGTTLANVALVALAAGYWDAPGAKAMLVGGWCICWGCLSARSLSKCLSIIN